MYLPHSNILSPIVPVCFRISTVLNMVTKLRRPFVKRIVSKIYRCTLNPEVKIKFFEIDLWAPPKYFMFQLKKIQNIIICDGFVCVKDLLYCYKSTPSCDTTHTLSLHFAFFKYYAYVSYINITDLFSSEFSGFKYIWQF